MNRRQFCLGITAVVTAISGCSGRDTNSTPETVADSETEPDVTETTQRDSTPGAVAESGPESYLPDSTDGWDFRGTHEHDKGWSSLGASDGTIGQYQGPDGNSYEFVVMDTREGYTEGTARSLACAGWQIAIAIDGYAIGASTGTEQRTFTPEVPPTMTQSAVPDTEDRVRELLALSPRLSKADIDENRINC